MGNVQEQALASLEEIGTVERRTRTALAYRPASAFLILWGEVVAAGALLNQAFPEASAPNGVDATGLAGSVAIAVSRLRRGARAALNSRFVASFAVFLAYGVAWSYLPAPAGNDRIAVFWATLVMVPSVIAGLWWAPLFAFCGLIGTALSFAAFFAGPWLHLWIGLTFGAAFVLGGLLLRRLGAG